MPGFCFCCLSAQEKVHMIMTNFGVLQRLDQIEKSEYPQFLCGRILPIKDRVLLAPISGKPCVYYEAFVEELQERSDENGLIGITDSDEPSKVWMPLFREVKAVDFTIIDPDFPNLQVYVPGGTVPISVLANEDTITRSRLRSKLIVRDVNKQNSTKEFLARANINIEGHPRVLRFREANFEKGEQIAILGVADFSNPSNTVLKQVDQSVLTDSFFERKNLGEWDRLAWKDCTSVPCLVVTDMGKYFQGLTLKELPSNLPLADVIDPSHTITSSSMER